MDPREAILRHGNKAADEYSAWTAAYSTTQPKPIFEQEEEEPKEDDD